MNVTITHLLGYLTKKQWMDAIKNYNVDKKKIKELLKDQENAYSLDYEDLKRMCE